MKNIDYNIIIPKTSGYSMDDLKRGELADFTHLFSKGEYCWTLQTYHALKGLGLSLDLSMDLNPNAVNLAHGNTLRSLRKRSSCFCVSIQADFPHFPLAQCHIVQNKDQASANATFVPHWPQVGQIPRNSSRHGLKMVAYQGMAGFTDLTQDQFNTDLGKFGIRFEMLDATSWQDLSNVDVLVGIRSFSKKEFKRKPPSKLANAWHAGIPFVGGWDSAYSQIGVPGEDYLRVASYEELLAAIVNLKSDDALYDRLVAAGRKKAVDFSFDAIAQRWKSLLQSEIADEYINWKNRPPGRLVYSAIHLRYALDLFARENIRLLYGVPAIKRMRDLYYDPLK